jgi:protein-tyrosine-phosphatase
VTDSILLVCRANLCRSPSAEVMLSRALSAAGVDAIVSSAGMEVVEGQSAPQDFVEIAYVRGIDLRAHKPVAFTPELAARYDLVLTMTRDLLRTMVIKVPALWPRAFTLLELVRRGVSLEPPERGDVLGTWLARVHASRTRAELVSMDQVDDLRDPMVDASENNEAMFGQLERSTRRLARLLSSLSG